MTGFLHPLVEKARHGWQWLGCARHPIRVCRGGGKKTPLSAAAREIIKALRWNHSGREVDWGRIEALLPACGEDLLRPVLREKTSGSLGVFVLWEFERKGPFRDETLARSLVGAVMLVNPGFGQETLDEALHGSADTGPMTLVLLESGARYNPGDPFSVQKAAGMLRRQWWNPEQEQRRKIFDKVLGPHHVPLDTPLPLWVSLTTGEPPLTMAEHVLAFTRQRGLDFSSGMLPGLLDNGAVSILLAAGLDPNRPVRVAGIKDHPVLLLSEVFWERFPLIVDKACFFTQGLELAGILLGAGADPQKAGPGGQSPKERLDEFEEYVWHPALEPGAVTPVRQYLKKVRELFEPLVVARHLGEVLPDAPNTSLSPRRL
jgi:hypothetical protein